MSSLALYFREAFQPPSLAFSADSGKIFRCLNVAGYTFGLNFSNPALLEMLYPALAHLQVPEPDNFRTPDFSFHLWDSALIGQYPPPPPFSNRDYNRYGQRALRDDGQYLLLHDRINQFLFGYDRAARQGFFWAEDASGISIYDRAAPLQTLFHWALGEFGWQILHAAALGGESGGVLLVGSTGAGKSTTALACLAASDQRLHYLSDDKCLVKLEPQPRAFGIFNSAKLKTDMLEHLDRFQALVAGQDDVFKAGKHLLFLYPEFRQQMVAEFPIKAILMPRISNSAQPSLRPVSPAQVLVVLGPSTVVWLAGAEASGLHLMANLVRQVPCYALNLARDPADNLDLIADTLQNHL